MRIVNRKTFLEQPIGTLFAKFKPCIFGDLCIKGESLFFDSGNDFYYQPIVDSIECKSSEEFAELLTKAVEDEKSLNMNFNYESRDGLFDEDQLFAIWEIKDVNALITRLYQARNR